MFVKLCSEGYWSGRKNKSSSPSKVKAVREKCPEIRENS
jgi:hypothetical protein